MIVKKFSGATTRDALRQVRDALGPDALILSNRPVPGGVEIMAVAEHDIASLTDTPAVFRPALRHQIPGINVAPSAPPREAGVATESGASPETQASARHAAGSDAGVEELAHELRMIRSMLEGQLAGFAWSELKGRDPAKLEVMRALLTAGFGPLLARQLVDAMPPGLDYDKGLRWAKAALVHNLTCAAPSTDIIEKGGVYALVGPTGVGKTTTVAKLAARCTLRHGPGQLALITTDSYRIGAHEQLRIYGKILGVPVYSVKDEADLQLTLADLSGKHLVLIDTVGMSQRDRRIAQQIALLCGRGHQVKRLLLLSATAHGSTLEDVVQAYRGAGLVGCALTKVDESMSLGPVLDVVVRHKLPVHYVTNGQRVPEDLHLANATYLIDRAFRPPREDTAFTPRNEEFSLALAAASASEDEYPAQKKRVNASA
jgi:flagellar biosynthesis protein FlhF